MDCYSIICAGLFQEGVTIWVIESQQKQHWSCFLCIICLPNLCKFCSWPFCENSSLWPCLEIIISVHKSYMYPIVIWLKEQKWQISLKSAQVDYPLISKAHALRDPHNCCLRLREQERPAYPKIRRTEPSWFHNAIRVCLLKVRLTLPVPLCASSHCVLSDWCWPGSPKPVQGITARCVGG